MINTRDITDQLQYTMNTLSELYIEHLSVANSKQQERSIRELFVIWRASLMNIKDDADELLEIPKTVCTAIGAAAILNMLGKEAIKNESGKENE